MARYVSAFCAAALALPFLATAGCATILGGGPDKTVLVKSAPAGAQVQILNARGEEVHSGSTPFTVTLHRGQGFFSAQSYTLRATAPGCAPRDVALKPGLNPWYFGNLLIGGIAGALIVDPLTGAMWEFPGEVKIDMAGPAGASGPPYEANREGIAAGDAKPAVGGP